MIRKLNSPHRSRPALLIASIISAASLCLLVSLDRANGQSPPPPAPPDAAPAQQPSAITVQGAVAQYLINPRGDVDGLFLADNTIVRFPPHLGAQLVQIVQPQTNVKVDGYSAVTGTIHATTITNTATGRSLADTPPAPGAPRPPRPNEIALQSLSATGTIKALTHAPRGEIDGAILSDGTIVHFGPANGMQLAALLKIGQPLAATGEGVANQYGKSLEANAVGKSPDQLQPVIAGPRRRGPGPKGAGAPVPPPPQQP